MSDLPLSEVYIQDCFHSYLRSSLAQAKAEKLLDVDVLASAEGDVMITGPALVLYFAAIRSTTNPPSVPLPRLDKRMPPAELSPDNCPPAYHALLRVWSNAVQPIQSLPPDQQHDLARLICSLPALAPSPPPSLARLAADLRAVAIEISQRRTFQERYSDDLQAALDAGAPTGSAPAPRASFRPPPSYEASSDAGSSPGPSPLPSPHLPMPDLPPTEPLRIHHRRTPSQQSDGGTAFPTPHFDGKFSPSGGVSPSHALLSPASAAFPDGPGGARAPSPTPSLPASALPALELIRETLYASLADVLARYPSLRALLSTDAPRAYFGSVALAVLDVSTTSVTRDGSVVGVLGAELTLDRCPPPLRPLMTELADIGHSAREFEEADSERAVQALTAGEAPPMPRLDRVRQILEEGVGKSDAHERGPAGDGPEGRRSVEGRAVAFANRINGLALRMTQLKPFRERQQEVFKVLAGITM